MTNRANASAGWTIRAGVPKDASDLLKIHRTAIFGARGRGYSQKQLKSWAEGLLAERYAEAMTAGDEYFLVAISAGGDVVGFCSYHDDEVIGLYVDPDWSRRDIGSTLLSTAESSIADKGYGECRLEAALPAVTFYRSHGYRTVGEHDVTTRGGLTVRVFDMIRPLR